MKVTLRFAAILGLVPVLLLLLTQVRAARATPAQDEPAVLTAPEQAAVFDNLNSEQYLASNLELSKPKIYILDAVVAEGHSGTSTAMFLLISRWMPNVQDCE